MGISLLVTALAAGAAVSCPRTLPDTQHVEVPADADSVWYYRGPRYLQGGDVFVDHPSRRRSIEGEYDRKARSTSWGFTGREDIWLECGYRNSAAVVRIHVGSAISCLSAEGKLLEPGRVECRKPAP